MHVIGVQCGRTEVKSSTEKIQVLCASVNPSQSLLQLCSNPMQQVDTFKNPKVAFPSDGRQNRDTDISNR